ncbi:MAG: PAC2 family protein [Acidimicrobiia bacterium]|nr:PAC2 family protein [Acidimicrobiia bacterium]
MSVLWRHEPPGLRRPILVVGFEGWFDVAKGATGALDWLADQVEADEVAAIDPEPYFDFTARRPTVRLEAGQRVIDWPANAVRAAVLGDEGHDLLLLAGTEPHLRWRTFSEDLVEVARATSAELVITLGSMAEAVPHTRAPQVKGSSTNPALAARLGLSSPTYQGPTGIVGVLHDTLDRERIPVISLRVAVPHYVSGPPNPKAMRSLLQHLQHVTGVATNWVGLNEPADDWQRQVDGAVSQDSEASAYVDQLERQADAALQDDLPSGEDLAAEFERFLQERRDED